jgi:hypothetical protein
VLTYLKPLFSGNAVRLYTALPVGATYTRILRKTSDTFSGPTDVTATVVNPGFAGDSLVDHGVINGTTYFWHAWDRVGPGWVDGGASLSAVPATSYLDDTLDPQELLRDRIQLGINAEIARDALMPPSGSVQVTTAPFALPDGITFPTVSVHLESTGPAERAVGDEIEDFHDPVSDEYIGTEGWMSRWSMTVAGVSLNPDERITLRKVLRRIVQANLEVFADAGMLLIEFQQTDSEQFSENGAPLYFTNGAFSCVAPAFVRETEGLLSDVVSTLIPLNPLTGLPYP